MIDATNRNTALASALVEELARAGVRRAFLSPGSRSSPVALALDREPALELTIILDERSAGFAALGAALASGRPDGGRLHERIGGGEPAPGVVEADQAGRAADRAHLRSPAGAARDRRRADDRPDRALRLRRRAGSARSAPMRPTIPASCTCARPAAGRSPRRSAGAGPCTSTSPGAIRSAPSPADDVAAG